jgi:hypothetical protein
MIGLPAGPLLRVRQADPDRFAVGERFMKRCTLVILLFLNLLPAFGQEEQTPLNVFHGTIPQAERIFFVAPDGDNLQSGTEEEPWATLVHAVSQIRRGDVIVMRGGVYHHDATIRIQSPSGFFDDLIVLTAYPGEVPILDFSSQPKVRDVHGLRINANWWHVIGITVRYASHNGIRMDGSYNILEQVTAYGNHDSGIHMAGGASHNLIKNCDSFHNFNYDTARTPRIGNNADGFSAKFNIGPGNHYYGTRSWENSDDGYDFWEAQNTIVVEKSWAFGNGDASVFDNPANFEGNGNGFKLGGNFVVADHVVIRSMAFDNFGASGNAKGFDYNNNWGAMKLIHNTAYNNGRNYFFPIVPPENGQAVFLNNLSAVASQHAVTPAGAVLAGNSWQYQTAVTEDMFVSVDTEAAKGPRELDGSLPNIDLLKPVPGSFLVDGGVIIGEPFYGAAPDIGVHEFRIGEPVEPWVPRGSGRIVSDVRVYDMEHAEEWVIRGDMQVGVEAYEGSGATVLALPASLNIEDWIQTSAASRSKNYLFTMADFMVDRSESVFIAHADDVSRKPEWLSAYDATDLKLTVRESDGSKRLMTVYAREVEAGELITLGRNSTDGATDVPMYIVLVGTRVSVSVEDEYGPDLYATLNDIYPNPVVGSASISFTLARGSEVSIKIFDGLGREVAVVAEGYHAAGSYQIQWNAEGLPSGVYFCHMAADSFSSVQKLVRIR